MLDVPVVATSARREFPLSGTVRDRGSNVRLGPSLDLMVSSGARNDLNRFA